ncbi:MAG: 16S rRNA processing protein RimM [Clostridia bacterium]|nr:16S rRNA processing protein RimM [Clostridia bacterium]
MKKYLETGKIVATYGLKGEVRVTPWCNDADFLCQFKEIYLDSNGYKKLKITAIRNKKNIVIIKFAEIKSIEQAEKLCGKILYIDRKDVNLEEGEYFIQDIIGMDVFDKNTEMHYGKVTDVYKTGANDVYEITSKDNKKYLIPVIDDVDIKIDIEKKLMKINPIRGIFEDEN